MARAYVNGLINTITIHPKQQSKSRDYKANNDEQERKGNPKDADTIKHDKEQRDTPKLKLKVTTDVGNLGPNRDDEESIETNIDPSLSNVVFGRPFIEIDCLAINRNYGLMTFTDEIKEITFKTSYKDQERSELSSEGHDLLSSRVILSEDDYGRGCRKPSDLKDGFYRDTIKLGPEYLTEIDDEEEVT
uniref:Uncharacterized protein n=1 Tax=Tanacetum cinerariifolium TaxID=118510 RepID=A0A6L2KK17_TANCI|nr:hypothetical protein [Tanacetum cinerariifolium]